jgi:DNA invertase Pin-like site-specific DNA recombinase
MICAIYCRKSTKEEEAKNPQQQRDGVRKSVDQQESAARAFIKARGWRLGENAVFVDDAKSGKLFEEGQRPALDALKAAIKARKVGAVVVWMRDRIGRDTVERLWLTKAIEAAGVEIWAAQDGSRVTLADENDEVREFMSSWADSKRRKDDAKNVRRGMADKAESGGHVGGMVYGYKLVPVIGADGQPVLNKHGRVVTARVIEPESAKIVKLIFDLRLRGWGQPTIANYLNGEKVTHNGKEHQRTKVLSPRWDRKTHRKVNEVGDRIGSAAKASGYWSAAGIRGITARRIYCGWYGWADVKETFHKDLVIIPEKTWDDVQRLDKKAGESFRRKNGQLLGPTPRVTGRHWITRVVRCGIVGADGKTCDGPMRRDEKDGLEYLRCSRGKGHTRRLSIKRATRSLIEKFSDILQPAFITARLGEMVKLHGEAKLLGAKDRAKLEAEIAGFDLQIRKLVKALGIVDAPEEIKAEIEGVKLMRQAVADKLAGAELLYEFNSTEFSDIVEAVTTDWQRQIKRNPDVIGAVLSKTLRFKLPVVPPAEDGEREWRFGPVDVDLLPVIREADADRARAIEALMRELNLRGEEVDQAKSRKRGRVPTRDKALNSDRPRSARG